jgi:hypothetical protein
MPHVSGETTFENEGDRFRRIEIAERFTNQFCLWVARERDGGIIHVHNLL